MGKLTPLGVPIILLLTVLKKEQDIRSAEAIKRRLVLADTTPLPSFHLKCVEKRKKEKFRIKSAKRTYYLELQVSQ